MDLIKNLLTFFIKLAFGIFFIVIVWWMVSALYPALSVQSLVKKVTASSSDVLPSPKAYRGLFGMYSNEQSVKDLRSNSETLIPVIGDERSKPSSISTYTYGWGTTTPFVQEVKVDTTKPKPYYLRNLSIYENGHIYTGLAFVGEARSTMFREGKFPIIVLDQGGRVVGVSAAIATTDWTVAGWTRFETKIIYTLPTGSLPCTMVFEQGLTSKERLTNTPLRIPFRVKCN